MSILITGGTGFVGLNLAEHLLADGEDVILFALRGLAPRVTAHLESLRGKLMVIEGDVRDGAGARPGARRRRHRPGHPRGGGDGRTGA